MNADNLTPIRSELEPTQPPDIDTATMAISQARAIVDLLAVQTEDADIALPDTKSDTLLQALYAVLSELDRAMEALCPKETAT